MSRLLKIVAAGLTVIGLGILAASCGSTTAQYRIVNAIANPEEAVDIYINFTNNSSTPPPPTYADVLFESTEPGSGYSKLSGNSTLEVFQTGQNQNPWINASLNLGADNLYTVLLKGNSSTEGAPYPFAAQVFQDTNPVVTSGDVEFRILYAAISFGSGAIDVYIIPSETPCCPGTPAAKALSYANNNSGYVNVGLSTSNSLTAYMTISGTASQIGNPFTDAALSAGQIHTLVIVDQLGGSYPPTIIGLATN